jgi:hypothetical protein
LNRFRPLYSPIPAIGSIPNRLDENKLATVGILPKRQAGWIAQKYLSRPLNSWRRMNLKAISSKIGFQQDINVHPCF